MLLLPGSCVFATLLLEQATPLSCVAHLAFLEDGIHLPRGFEFRFSFLEMDFQWPAVSEANGDFFKQASQTQLA